MDCQHLHRSAGLASLWHLRRCPSCRAAQAIDKVIARGIERMQAEPAPASGQARVLAEMTALFPPRPRSRPRPIWRHRVLPSGVFTVGLAAAGYGWIYWSNLDPNVTIPARVMPPVNAFDTYRSACEAEKDAQQVSNAATVQISPIVGPTEITKRIGYRTQIMYETISAQSTVKKPGDLLVGNWISRPHKMRVPVEREYPIPKKVLLIKQHAFDLALRRERLRLLQRNAPALALLHKGLREPYMSPASLSKNTDPKYLHRYDNLESLLILEQADCEERGDWIGAVSSGLDAMQFGEQIARGEAISSYLTAIEFASISRKRLWEEIRHLNAAQTRAIARRLEQIIALHVPLANAYQEDKWIYQSWLKELFHNRGWRLKIHPLGFDPRDQDPNMDRMYTFTKWLRLSRYSTHQIMDQASSIMDQRIESARHPNWIKPYVPPIPEDPVNTWLLPARKGERLEWDRLLEADDRTQNNLLLVCVALQAYRNDHGVYPSALSQLVPRFLHAVPDDPFAQKGPLRYRRKSAKYVLYSIGPDGIDQQGTPIGLDRWWWRASATTNANFQFGPNAKGDIVAGIDLG